ncbi:MAG: redoxin domain-containing protein, partial [Chloroflexi bacterium]|nr:redoxin domain-containing protein [Chloroflexota bacterium]
MPAPEFPGGHTWFNVSEPLSLAGLQGKVVLLDFWTSGCINCQQIIPDLDRLEEEFADELVIIGVHSGKYDREQEDQSVRQSLLRYGLKHPVVNDPDFIIWSIYGVNAWPT